METKDKMKTGSEENSAIENQYEGGSNQDDTAAEISTGDDIPDEEGVETLDEENEAEDTEDDE